MRRSAIGIGAFVDAVTGVPGGDTSLDRAHERLAAGGALVADAYEVETELGRGGLGIVYLARDLELGREVALKLLRHEHKGGPAARETLALLEREARATAVLNHPNIVIVHRYGMWEGLPFLVLERLRGESLAARLERGPLPADEAVGIAAQILAGLAHAHAHGVLHRDLSPGNVFLRDDGVVKILDFGMSSLRTVAARRQVRVPGRTLLGAGTPGYMAPEQERGEPIDARADVWAVGRLLLQMLGRGRGDAAPAPAAVCACAARACADAPEARYPDAASMRAALLAGAPRRRRAVLVVALVALVGALAAGAWMALRPVGAPVLRPEVMLATHRASAHLITPDQAPALEGRYLDEQHPGDSDACLELVRSARGYHVYLGSGPCQTPLAAGQLVAEGEADVYQAGPDFYLLATARVLGADREHMCEYRLEPSGALFLETAIIRSLAHVPSGVNVRGYRYSRVLPVAR